MTASCWRPRRRRAPGSRLPRRGACPTSWARPLLPGGVILAEYARDIFTPRLRALSSTRTSRSATPAATGSTT